MNEFSEGDLIEATKGETVIRGRLNYYTDKDLWVGDALRMLETLQTPDDGWTFTVIEKAAPALPTEPGTVITWRDEAYLPQIAQLDGGEMHLGWRHNKDVDGCWYSPLMMAELIALESSDGKHTVLEPVADTAKTVLERVRGLFGEGALILNEVDDIAAEFGVAS